MKKRCVLIGINGFAIYWRKAWLPAAARSGALEVVGLYNRSERGMDEARADLNLPRERCYTDARALLEETRPDFVILVVPPQAREQMVDLALEYGCDILSEKPLAFDPETCARIYRKVRASGRKMLLTMTHTLSRDKQTLLREIASGRHGPLANLTGSLTVARQDADYEDSWRLHMDYYYMLDAAVHQLDMLRTLCGSEARKVFCKGWSPEWAAFRDVAVYNAIVEMDNGVIGNYMVSSCSAANLNWWYQDYIRADCRDSVLVLDNQRLTAHSGREISWDPHMNITRQNIVRDIPLLDGDRWGNMMTLCDFLDWINGGPEPQKNIVDHLHTMALAFAAIESIKTGAEVDVHAVYDAMMEGSNA